MDTANTCLAAGIEAYKTLALYTHLIPAVLAIFLGVFILYKTKFSFQARAFALFLILFTLWLLGDLMTWAQVNYFVIAFNWAYLDYINIAFVLAGLYFFLCLIREKDIKFKYRIFLFMLSIPAFVITMSGSAIFNFYIPYCEATENLFLTNYKFAVEIFSIIVIVITGSYEFIRATAIKRKQILILGGSMFLFFLIFGGTEYISSVTDVYEINLYSLLILPIFLFIITFSITNLQIFKIRFIETQLLVYVLIIMTGSQLLFIESIADVSLSLMTLLVSIVIAVVLLRNVSAQSKQRKRIEELALQLENTNRKLDNQNKLKSEFLSLAAHQIRGPLTAIKGYASMLMDGTFGSIDEKQKDALTRIFESTNHLVNVVADLLNISKIEQGGLVFEMSLFDLKRTLADIVEDMKISASAKNLAISFKVLNDTEFIVRADLEKLRQVFLNLIDNSLKYTTEGSVAVTLGKDSEADVYEITIRDTGIGMSKETIAKLFEKFSRGEGRTINSGGSGLGLYLAKQIVEVHKGTVKAESNGVGLGSTFVIRIPIATKVGANTASVAME